jgi:hypothetical protein
MQHSFINEIIYKNMFILFRENDCYMIDLQHIFNFGIFKYGTCKDVWML